METKEIHFTKGKEICELVEMIRKQLFIKNPKLMRVSFTFVDGNGNLEERHLSYKDFNIEDYE